MHNSVWYKFTKRHLSKRGYWFACAELLSIMKAHLEFMWYRFFHEETPKKRAGYVLRVHYEIQYGVE